MKEWMSTFFLSIPDGIAVHTEERVCLFLAKGTFYFHVERHKSGESLLLLYISVVHD
jgi:hypothetical protein